MASPLPRRGRDHAPRHLLRSCLLAVGVLALGLAVAGPVQAADHWPTRPTRLDTTVTFYGRGAGHGVGLSQYGARGRAEAGQDVNRILAAYYTGARPATTDPDRLVRVLLDAEVVATADRPLTILGVDGDWMVKGVAATFPAGSTLRVWLEPGIDGGPAPWRLAVTDADGTTELYAAASPAKVVVRPAAEATRLQVVSAESTFDTYRGALKLVLDESSVGRVINRVGLDDYLRGVVPVEMPRSWPRAALRAQAVASRSYAVRRLHPDHGSFDIYDDGRTQLYRGVAAESERVNRLIDGAPGAILVKGRHDRAINAFYSSAAGGATEDNEYAFVGPTGLVTSSPVPYLRGIADRAPDGRAYDADAPHYRWRTTTLTRTQLSAILGADPRTDVGRVRKLDLTRRGVSGRLYRIRIIGSEGRRWVSADVFRAVFNAGRPAGSEPLRSNLFDTRPVGR